MINISLILLISLGVIKSLLKEKAGFKLKKIFDIFRYILLYITMISCFSEHKIWLCIITSFSMISSTFQLYEYTKIKRRQDTDDYKMILISCTIELFVSMALTYYTLYIINPNWFQVNGILLNSVRQKLFEFAYLTFSILTTYSSGIIVITGIVPRIFQIIHTIIGLTLLVKTLDLVFAKEK